MEKHRGLRKVVTAGDELWAQRCAKGCVSVIDDDAEIRNAVCALVMGEGYAAQPHENAAAFLAEFSKMEPRFPGPTCVLSDVKMPLIDGLALQKQLARQDDMPLILMSGASGLDEAVSAFRAGAIDFLVKPFEAEALLDAVGRALALSTQRQQSREQHASVKGKLGLLSAREREVARQVASGRLNREIAEELGIAVRTVKHHRQQAMEKLGVDSVVDLARLMDKDGGP